MPIETFETVVITESDEVNVESKQIKNIINYVMNTDENILFIGEGGMGKTMSMLHIWKKSFEFKKNNKLFLYIPLNEFNIYSTSIFIQQFVIDNYNIYLHTVMGMAKVVLLLDGFNEITKDNRQIIREIMSFLDQNNVQVILTSRYDFRTAHGFHTLNACRLQPLDFAIVVEYLKKCPDKVYELFLEKVNSADWSMINLLQNPMMLTLYANTSIISKQIDSKFPDQFIFSDNNTVAGILQNYITCQIGRLAIENDPDAMIITAFTLYHVIPYIAHRLENKEQLTVPQKNLNSFIEDFLSINGVKTYNTTEKDLSKILQKLNSHSQRYQNNVQMYINLIVNKLHLLLEEDANYVFRHQYFRDFLSATYIKTVLEENEYQPDS